VKTRDEFDWWLTCLPDKVKALRARLPELAAALDGSVASIEPLVAHLIAHHTYDALIAPAQAELLDQVAAYVGDVAERAMPSCAWAIPLDDPADADHGMAILRFTEASHAELRRDGDQPARMRWAPAAARASSRCRAAGVPPRAITASRVPSRGNDSASAWAAPRAASSAHSSGAPAAATTRPSASPTTIASRPPASRHAVSWWSRAGPRCDERR
jgi:hypothetical protein